MVTLRLFGGALLEGEHGVTRGQVTQSRRLALLALLATAPNSSLSRDKLIAYLWPDCDVDKGRHRLNESLHVLRKALGTEAILSEGDALRLNLDQVSSDVAAFDHALQREDLEHAVSLHAGPFLDGFFLRHAPDFERWAETERRHRSSRYEEALEVLAARAEATGDLVEAVHRWKGLAAHDPFNSRFAVGLMRVMAAGGDPANAIRHAEEHARVLEDELGVHPPEDVQAFAQQMRQEALPATAPRGGPRRTAISAADVERSAAGPRRVPRRGALVGLVGVVALAVLATVIVRGRLRTPGPQAAGVGRLAVLPCADRMGDPEQGYIPAGVHDEIVAGLGRIAAVEVRGRSSVMRYRETAMSPQEIARELNVGGLVECSVHRASADSVRVTASLVDAQRDRQLWSGTYQRASPEVFLLGSDVARGVVEALHAKVTPTESARIQARPTRSQPVLTHYHRGRYLANRWTEEGIRKGIEHFAQAIALDSSFAPAYTGLAEAIMMRGDLVSGGDIRPVEYMPRARELVLKALALDHQLADAHYMLGYIRWYYDYDYAAGEHEARLATELDPADAAAWDFYAVALSARGRDEDAIRAARRAIELDPVAAPILSDLSWILVIARRYRQALDAANAAIELDPNLSTAYLNAAAATLLLDRPDQAVGLYERARALSDHPYYLAVLGHAYARIGDRERALAILDTLMEMRRHRYVSPRAVAEVYLGLDSLDMAMEWLMLAAEVRDPGVNLQIRHPRYDALRDHPRYCELLQMMRLTCDGY